MSCNAWTSFLVNSIGTRLSRWSLGLTSRISDAARIAIGTTECLNNPCREVTLIYELKNLPPLNCELESVDDPPTKLMSTARTPSNNRQSLVITDADAPFNNSKADVILRSANNVDFRVLKSILSLSSPIFEDTFALPQALAGDNSNEMKDGLPVVQLTEDKKTLEMLLSMCYPTAVMDPRDPKTLTETHRLLDAAIKYNVERVEKRVRGWIFGPRFLNTDPVRVFAIACHYQLGEEAKIAAAATAFKPLLKWPYGQELHLITGWQMYQLLRYHECGVEAISKIFTDFGWIKQTHFCWFNLRGDCPRKLVTFGKVTRHREVCGWWSDYMDEVAVALKDGLWDEAKDIRLTEAALHKAHSTNCGAGNTGMAMAGMQEFKDILRTRMKEVLSEVCLFAYIKSPHLPSLLIGSIGPRFLTYSVQNRSCAGGERSGRTSPIRASVSCSLL